MLALHLFSLLPAASMVSGLPSLTKYDASEPSIVDLGYAKYQGVRLAAGVTEYLGMRYAQPPLGDLRFRAPKDPFKEEGIQEASRFRSICLGSAQSPSGSIGEDCLFVNVFTPSRATPMSKLPVWLYFQGGGYRANSNNNYNGTKVIEESGNNIVFVNFNYRVGPLGFLASEEVRRDGDLNAGLLDQRKLLRWVKKNISKFGGDPNHVVIHGTSAGAGSVTHHLTAYGGRNDGLFVGAAVQSNFWPPLRTVEEVKFQFDRFLKDIGCSGVEDALACLRLADLSAFLAASEVHPLPGSVSDSPLANWYWLPVIDGDLIRRSLYEQFKRGQFIKVPLLIGNTNDEGSNYSPNASSPMDITLFFKNNFPDLDKSQLQDILNAYPLLPPLADHAKWFPSASAAYGDATFRCPGNQLAIYQALHFPPSLAWNYRFNVLDPGNEAAGKGVTHAQDTSAIFGVGYNGGYPQSYTTTNAAIVPITMHYYISFIRSLNPNTYRVADAPFWRPWGSGRGMRLRIQTNATAMEAIPAQLTRQCNLWRSLSDEMEV